MKTIPILPSKRRKSVARFEPSVIPFDRTLHRHGVSSLAGLRLTTVQVNVGKLCNQTCHHCHVDAGPQRTEIMSRETIDQLLRLIETSPYISTVDITGGAPEMNPHFEHLVRECRRMGKNVIDRCNLTVLLLKGKEHLPQFLADQHVEIIASLPCYLGENVDSQRGKGVFDRSLTALKQLNALGYGVEGSGRHLHLVYNPLGPKLPPAQHALEEDYKDELARRFGVTFNRLYTITNMPISRFLDELEAQGALEEYMDLLIQSFNPHSVDELMCRTLISVGWDGTLYDCDFNQMLNLTLRGTQTRTLTNTTLDMLDHRAIATGVHCYGCTAGAGSSCGGALAAPSS